MPFPSPSSVAAHYDGIAPHYDETIPPHVAGHYRAKRVRFVRSLTPAGALLDVGCGTGALAAALVEAGYEVTGLDASTGMLARLLERCRARAVAGYSDGLPFRDSAFDGAITVATLHHIAAPARVAATIAEMVRVVRPGGVVVLWDHNPENPYWPILMRRVPQDTGEERLVPLREITDALGRAGITQVRTYRLGLVPDFVPPVLLPAAQRLESLVERTPGIRRWAAHNVVVGVK